MSNHLQMYAMETSHSDNLCVEMVVPGKKSFRCVCRDGFFGDRCEQAYECAVNPCLNGGSCTSDGKIEFICQCQQGYDGERCQKVKTCVTANKAFVYALSISVTHENYGGTARFKCLDGMTQFGDLTATCNINGVWELQGRCLVTNCGDPPAISGMTLINATNHTLNGLAKYKCSDGYTTHENQDFLLCKAVVQHHYRYRDWRQYGEFQALSGQWISNSGQNSLSCHPIPNCGQPPVIANANVTVTSTLMHGVATYRCNSGYELSTNQFSAEIHCSRHGQWINKAGMSGINFQCFMLPDCGRPPKIPHAVVTYSKTLINSTASYKCRGGYHLIGSETAICWRIDENRLQKWVDWLFVPKCEFNCPVKVGRHGNVSVVDFQVFVCHLSGFEMFSANLSCGSSVRYALKRKQLNISEEGDDGMVFYGRDLCVAKKVQKIKYYENSVVYNTTKCRSLCFQYPLEIRDIVVYDELRYTRNPSNHVRTQSSYVGKGISDFNVGETTRKQTIVRYVLLSSSP